MILSDTNTIIAEYEDILMGKEKEFSQGYFGFKSAQNEVIALKVYKYVFEVLLRWEPNAIAKGINMELLKKLKLDKLLPYIEFPLELDKTKDLYYIAHRMYPDKVKLSQKDLVINVYKKVLKGEMIKFHKEFFFGSIGRIRAAFCLQYMIMHYVEYDGLEDLYAKFSDIKYINSILRKHKLYQACTILYEKPIDFLHEALPDIERNELFYNYYSFLSDFKDTQKAINKTK